MRSPHLAAAVQLDRGRQVGTPAVHADLTCGGRGQELAIRRPGGAGELVGLVQVVVVLRADGDLALVVRAVVDAPHTHRAVRAGADQRLAAWVERHGLGVARVGVQLLVLAGSYVEQAHDGVGRCDRSANIRGDA